MLETKGKILLNTKVTFHLLSLAQLSTLILFLFGRVTCFCISMYQLRGMKNLEKQKSTQTCIVAVLYKHTGKKIPCPYLVTALSN